MNAMKPAKVVLPLPPAPLPPSVLDQLRRWRLGASLRFVGKALAPTHPAPKATTKTVAPQLSVWDAYIARLALQTGRDVAELDREEGQRILAKLEADRKARMVGK